MAGNKGKKKLIKIVAILVLLPVGILVPALSIRSYHLPLTNAQSQDSNSSLETRKKKYQAIVGEDVSTTDLERIETRCLAVQTNIATLGQRLNNVQTKREQVYGGLLDKLTSLSSRLQNQAFNTEDLDANVSTLDAKIAKYKTTMKAYTQAVDDMTKIDCTEDPTSFTGALEEARTKHAELITQVRDIREYVINTIKPTLQQIKQALAEGRTTGGSQ